MRQVSATDTKPEIAIRRFLYANGFRYRKNFKKIAGKPDLFILKYRVAIFIHGCFWHGHPGCKHASFPKSNRDYWINKITGNINRDIKNIQTLTESGIRSIVIWECEINTIGKRKHRLENLINQIYYLD